jgi:hypothetical protein
VKVVLLAGCARRASQPARRSIAKLLTPDEAFLIAVKTAKLGQPG